MPKNSFKISDFKLKNVYSLPTIEGLVLSGLLFVCLWYSIFNNSNIERWIFILMLLMCLINLLETSYPFRLIEIKVLPVEPPFSTEPTQLNIEIRNPSDVRSSPLWVRLNGPNKWIEVSPVQANTSQRITLAITFPKPGPQALPKIRVKTYADSGLFRYWRVFDVQMNIIVLPKPVDHMINAPSKRFFSQDNDLAGFEEILDPSRFKFADPKLFQKLNRRYQRVFQSRRVSTKISFRWADLNKLPHEQKGEQFSFWMRSLAVLQAKELVDIDVEAPFIQTKSQIDSLDLGSIKSKFANWFYAQV